MKLKDHIISILSQNKFLKINQPFFYGLASLADIAKGTSDNNITWIIASSTNNRYHMVYMILFKFFVTPVTFTFLLFILVLDIISSQSASVLLKSRHSFSVACIVFCSMGHSIGTPLFSDILPVGISIHEFLPLIFIGIFQAPLFCPFASTRPAFNIKSVWLSFVEVKVFRSGGELLLTGRAFLKYFFRENGGIAFVSFMQFLCFYFVQTFSAISVKPVLRAYMRSKVLCISWLRLMAFAANLLFWRRYAFPRSWHCARMFECITFAHIFASACNAIRCPPIFLRLIGIKEVPCSRKDLFASMALLLEDAFDAWCVKIECALSNVLRYTIVHNGNLQLSVITPRVVSATPGQKHGQFNLIIIPRSRSPGNFIGFLSCLNSCIF